MCLTLFFVFSFSLFPKTSIWKAMHAKNRKGKGLLKLNSRVKEETVIL